MKENLKRKGLLFALLWVMSLGALFAQNITVQGTVLDEHGDAVIGAVITVVGSVPLQGTVADIDGNFTISAPAGSTLEFTSVGFATQRVAATANMHVVLVTDMAMLDELVVIGMGVQRRANLTGAVSTVSRDELASRPITNVSNALQGLSPGLIVMSGQGRPGGDGGTLLVRGMGTLNQGHAAPLILVDGVQTGDINRIDPEDIESISILRDAGAAAIYGSRAANGVILITTRRGTVGAPRVTYSGSFGVQTPVTLIERMSSYDYARLLSQAQIAAGLPPRFSDEDLRLFRDGSSPFTHPNTDWYREAFRTGILHRHNVSASGGTDHMTYMASVGILSQDGILPNSDRRQFSGRMNLGMQASPRLHVRMNMSYIHNNHRDPTNSFVRDGSDQLFRQLNVLAPWIVGRYPDGTWGSGSDGSPLAWLDVGHTINRYDRNFSGLLSAEYRIIDGLRATLQGSYVAFSQHFHEFQHEIQYNPRHFHGPNRLEERFWASERVTFDALLNFDRQFGLHGLSALAGWNVEQFTQRDNRMVRMNFPNNQLTDMNAGATATQTNSGNTRELALISGFGRIQYDFAGRYLLEANFRADASSRFAPEYRWGYFPSFSAGWRISEEEFMTNTRGWLNNLMIRGSWGILGDQQSRGYFYPWILTYALNANYTFGGVLQTGYALNTFSIRSFSWERVRNSGIAIHGTLWNMFNFSIDYYDRLTSNIIMQVPVPAEFGLGAYHDNVATVLNRGVEVTLGFNRRWNDFRMSATANITYNHNRIVCLGYNMDGTRREQLAPDNYNISRVGHRVGAFYLQPTNGIFRSQAEVDEHLARYTHGPMFTRGFFRPGDVRFVDANGDGVINAGDRQIGRSHIPDTFFGLNLNFGYRQFDLSMMFSGQMGAVRYYNEQVFGSFDGDASHPSTWWLNAWTPENPNTNVPRIWQGNNSNSDSRRIRSDFWLQSTDFVRLRNLQFGYTVPTAALQNIGISRLRVFYTAENVFTLHRIPVRFDPESPSSRGSNYPLLRTHSLGLNITL